MKTLYVHAGLPKCGSSALQVFFAKNMDNLLKNNIEYFSIGDIEAGKKGSISSGNGSLLSRSMLRKEHEAYLDRPDLYSSLLDKVINSNKDVGLLSSEFFAVLPLDKIKKWKEDLLKIGVKLKFIFYARRQDQFLMSSYMQRVKRHGYTGDPSKYIQSEYKKIHFLNYFGYFNQYENILGKENLNVSIYESTKQHEKGLVGHFMDIITGKCPDWVQIDPVVNTSPSPLEIKLILIANKYGPRMKFSDYIIEDSIKAGRSSKFKEHSIVSPEVLNEVMEYFKEQNKLFEEKYTHGQLFPDIVSGEFVDINNLQFTSEDVMDIISGLMVRFDRRLLKLEEAK